jgi:predicted RNA-binding protein with PUA-like domain
MTTQYWLVKQEPEAYSWDTFLKDKKTSWEGVRNYQARNNLRAMKAGDPVLFYASVTTKAIQGVAEVAKTAYPDPTADEGDWVAVQLKAVRSLPRPVTLDEIKADEALKNMLLVRHSRLSVMPVTKQEFDRIVALSKA